MGGVALTPEATPDVAFDVRADTTGWFESLLAQAPTQDAHAAFFDPPRPGGTQSTRSRPRDSSPTYHLADSQTGDFDLSSAATHVATNDSATEHNNPDGLLEQRRQLAALHAELLELLPATDQQQQVRAGLWILLVPKVIAHSTYIQRCYVSSRFWAKFRSVDPSTIEHQKLDATLLITSSGVTRLAHKAKQ